MEFPIAALLSREQCTQRIVEHFHPNGFGCNQCGAGVEQAGKFRTTHRRQLTVYRCCRCDQTYNRYTGTLLEQHHLRSEQVVLFLRGLLTGESSKTLASELHLSYKTVLTLRHPLQGRAQQLQPEEPLPDAETETYLNGYLDHSTSFSLKKVTRSPCLLPAKRQAASKPASNVCRAA
jgi:transposase-like protein